MTTGPVGAEPGTCTVIVARIGPRAHEQDLALINASWETLGLSDDAKGDFRGLARPEFRLVEGVSRATAERVAAAAVRAGFRPRVRDTLGIRWSSQRGAGGLLFVGLVFLVLPLLAFLLSSLVTAIGISFAPDAVVLGAVPMALLLVALPVYLASLVGAVLWQRSRIYLPLIVSPERVFDSETSTSADSELVREARAAVSVLRRALVPGLPAVARTDLAASADALDRRVTALARDERTLAPGSRAGLEALQRRRDVLLGRAAPDPEELASLEQAIREETEADEARERRHVEVVRDLLAIRRAATEARLSLADPEAGDPVAKLNREVAALEHVRTDSEPQRSAVLRARRSQREA